MYFLQELKDRRIDPEIFFQKEILELGCGTGLAAIALLLSEQYAPKTLVLSDADPATLELCRENCERNLSQHEDRLDRVKTLRLEWGREGASHSTYNTILATDVLYDIESLKPLLHSVHDLLRPGGAFCLAHVPRCSLPGQSKVADAPEMESFIIKEARQYNLVLETVIRPDEDTAVKLPAENARRKRQEMADASAAIMIFGKRTEDKCH
jgi:SAM-dependent methyltransferase